MKTTRNALRAFLGAILLGVLSMHAVAATPRDGAHDFDFLFGTWKSHFKVMKPEARLTARANDPNEWYEFDGVNTISPLMGGGGNVDDGVFDRPTGRTHAITLRLYDAKKREWSLYWATPEIGLGLPAQVGRFDENGVGEFFANDTWKDKPVIVRYRWTHTASSWHFEQSFSADRGKTWETNWISDSVERIQ